MNAECAFAQPGIDKLDEIRRQMPRNTKVSSDFGDIKTKFTTVGNAIEKPNAESIEIGSSTPVNTLEIKYRQCRDEFEYSSKHTCEIKYRLYRDWTENLQLKPIQFCNQTG